MTVPFRTSVRSMIANTTFGLLVIVGLAGCGITEVVPELFHKVEVVNFCGGDDAMVNVYIDDVFQGTVYLRRDFTVLMGTHELRAVGTGRNGGTFRDTTYVGTDLTWTLCPLRALGLQGETEEHRLVPQAPEGPSPDQPD